MFNVLERLYRIARASGASKIEALWDSLARARRGDHGTFDDSFNDAGGSDDRNDYHRADERQYRYSGHSDRRQDEQASYPKQVIEDLVVFDLTPPSSFEAVRKARNREIRKYHSDKFINDPEKFETSKQIMQIINAAYERLKDYYTHQSR